MDQLTLPPIITTHTIHTEYLQYSKYLLASVLAAACFRAVALPESL